MSNFKGIAGIAIIAGIIASLGVGAGGYPSSTVHPPNYCDGDDYHGCYYNKCSEVMAVVNDQAGPCGRISGEQSSCRANRTMKGYGEFPLNRKPTSPRMWNEDWKTSDLSFLGCVASTESDKCPIYVLGVGGTDFAKDAKGSYLPGCYFASSGGNRVDDKHDAARSSCFQGPNDYAMSGNVWINDDQTDLVNPEDLSCMHAMGVAGNAGFKCHSWGTAFCAQNQTDGIEAAPSLKLAENPADVSYYGGLCPVGGTCLHNRGDKVPCVMYGLYHEGQTDPGNCSRFDALNWGPWDQANTPRYKKPLSTTHCIAGSGGGNQAHDLENYSPWHDANPGQVTPGDLNTPDITKPPSPGASHEHQMEQDGCFDRGGSW